MSNNQTAFNFTIPFMTIDNINSPIQKPKPVNPSNFTVTDLHEVIPTNSTNGTGFGIPKPSSTNSSYLDDWQFSPFQGPNDPFKPNTNGPSFNDIFKPNEPSNISFGKNGFPKIETNEARLEREINDLKERVKKLEEILGVVTEKLALNNKLFK